MTGRLEGLVAATHTPFASDGSLNLPMVERQAAHLLAHGVRTAFVGGSTGECHSLTLDERRKLAVRWLEVARSGGPAVVVHVGSNCLDDARTLAAEAGRLGAVAISALAPSYFKPASLDALIACCAHVAAAAPDCPFYYYDIPSMTGVSLPMPEFLRQAGDRVPALRGVKFSHPDLAAYQECGQVDGGRFDILWGVDEMLLGALACGARGAVGSTYNFAAAVSQRLMEAFRRGDPAAAQEEQARSIRIVRALTAHGYMASAKAVMTMQGVDVGPPRLPHTGLTPDQLAALQRDLDGLL